MRRRDFVAGAGGAVASAALWPLATRAQQLKVRRVGALFGGSGPPEEQAVYAAFLRRLDELGWRQDRTLRVEVRWGRGSPEQLRIAAGELLAWQPDVMLAFTNLALAELKPMAGSLPIIFAGVGDPVGGGFVASLPRPGSNTTGFETYLSPMGGKWLQVLKETVPTLTRALVLYHPETESHRGFWRSIQEAAPILGMEVTAAGVHDAGEILDAISSFATLPNGGVVSLPHAVTNANNELIVALELRYRLPGIYAGTESAGSLVYYGIEWQDEARKAAEYVDRVLRGAKPADLPVQAPVNYELIVNLKTAKAIGLTIPERFLVRADKVIE
jgi:putative tryptophan/tyrosine transport system substrate-binding protein